jgi:predicted dehydrogenase
VGVVGVGSLGFHHARLLAQLDAAHLVGVWDTNAARLQEVTAQLGIPAAASLDALLAQAAACIIAVPTVAHEAVAVAALEHGVHVLIEKPIAPSLDAADRILDAARRSAARVQIGHVERFNGALRAGEPYLQAPLFVECHRLAPFGPRGTDVAVVLDLMIHDLDLVLELVGSEATDVRAIGVPVLTPHVDIANARLEFANGAVALITASRISRDRTRTLRIYQPTGYFSLDLARGEGHFYRLKDGWQSMGAQRMEEIVEHMRVTAPEAEPLKLELESFVRAVRAEGEVAVTGAAGAHALRLALRVADAVQASPVAIARS